jgi:hypothetical protein
MAGKPKAAKRGHGLDGRRRAGGRRADMMLQTLLVETGTDFLHAYLGKHHK